MKFARNAIIIALVLIIIMVGLLVKTFYDAGEFKSIEAHFNGNCTSVTGVLSSEDITIHPQTGMAFISSADRRAQWGNQQQVRQGAIYGYDLLAKNPKLVNLTAAFTKEFNPHGIGLWISQDGICSLFVVNHRHDGQFVEIFDYRGNQLIHRESIAGDLMHSPNDVIPVGKRSFYVTNDHGNRSAFGRMVEEYLQMAGSSVLYYDGKSFRKVAQRLAYANGINVSQDGSTVYVAETVGHKVHVYDRDRDSGNLAWRLSIELGTGPDNIEIDENGDLWIGCHPKLLTFVKYSKDPRKLSPSQVLKLSVKQDNHYKVEEIYLNNGQPLSGSSVAAVFKDTLLIGSVFDHRFLICRLR
jgi:arylesterase/paraoxonase